MRRKLKQNAALAAAYALLVALGLLFYYQGVVQKQELSVYDNRITLIRRDGKACSYLDAEQMRLRSQDAEEPFAYALWGSEGTRFLQNRDLGRSAEVEVYAVEGSSHLLLPSSAVLDGMIGKSCLIGQDAAQSLFGVADATGLSITMDGCEYVVLGMLEGAQGAVFLAKDLHSYALDRMSLEVSEGVTLSFLERSVEGELGFSGAALD